MMAATNPYLSKEEYYALIFLEARILEHGISFNQFLVQPNYYLNEYGQESAHRSIGAGFKPLLPKQAEIAIRLRESDV